MKIGRLPPLPPNDGTGSSAPRTSNDEVVADEATKVTISKDAKFIAGMRGRAEQVTSPIREDLVEQVKAELADGTFEANSDLEKVVEGLLGEL
ncbi:MAG: flagellar biosynthesis anti-sigma factor FlgM [Myxococcota bacterium]